MSNPWDISAWPWRGDEDPEKTFAGVGRVTTIWEFIEGELSVLYSFFTGRYNDLGALTEYGEPAIFRARFARLADAARHYFTRSPNQKFEAEFDRLAALLVGFSDRRNEVAHGTVYRMEEVAWFRSRLDPEIRGRPNYMLIPPFHWGGKRASDGAPSYAYTSKELTALSELLFTLAEHARNYLQILQPARKQDVLPPRPSS